jgi:hypothetical protein
VARSTQNAEKSDADATDCLARGASEILRLPAGAGQREETDPD